MSILIGLAVVAVVIGLAGLFLSHIFDNLYDGNCPDCMGEGCEYCDYTGWPDGQEPK